MDSLNTFSRVRRLSVIVPFALLMALTASIPIIAQPTFQDEKSYRTESFVLSEPGALEVQTSGGHIIVEGTDDNKLRVEMHVHKNGRNLLPEDTDLGDWVIEISQSGPQVIAIAKRNSSGWNLFGGSSHPSISFVIYAPYRLSSQLSTSGGHINIRKLSGSQHVKTSGGHIKISKINGTVNARTSGGHIEVESISGDLNLRTSGGHITLNDIDGKIKAKTSGGHISAAFNTIDEYADLKTSGGNISISVPENIALDLDFRGTYVNASLDHFSGTTDRDEIKGTINGGGPELSARTSGGVVNLSFD